MNFSFPEPDVAELLGSEYATGRHVFICKMRPSYKGMAVYSFSAAVNGKLLFFRANQTGNDPDAALSRFYKQFGPHDSIHRFESLEEAHAAFPKFYMNPETAGDTWS